MADKLINEKKPKLTRSHARHLRRKRLLIARKEALKKNITIELVDKNNSALKSPQPEIESLEGETLISNNLTKSKARRLRRKSKKDNSDELENKKNLELIQIDSQKNYNNILIINANSDNKSINVDDSLSDKNEQVNDVFLVSMNVHEDKNNITNEIDNIDNKITVNKMNNETSKTREQIKAEREAKKLAKAASKGKKSKGDGSDDKNKASVSDGSLSISDKQDELTTDTTDFSHSLKTMPTDIESLNDQVKNMIIDERKSELKGSRKETLASVSDSVTNDSNVDNEKTVKSKSELRAERRAKQEAQRAAKELEKSQKVKSKVSDKVDTQGKKVEAGEAIPVARTKEEEVVKKVVKKVTGSGVINHEMSLFKHLYHAREQCHVDVPVVNSHLHPAIIRLGVQYKDKVIVGSNARCVAFLSALKQLICDYERPSQADFTRGLESAFQESMAYLHYCRPLAVSMQNALKHIKWKMNQLSRNLSDDTAKSKLASAIDTYIQEQIMLADEAISMTIRTKISNGDVILTYGYSSLIQKILCDAYDAGLQFRVIIADGRPWLEGRELLRRLAKHGVECSYILINALSFIMPGVNKVFLGAHAILANGAVMSRAGTAQVALMAKAFNVPVLVACETHKSCERVQTDSIVYNEIGDADELQSNIIGSNKKSALANWRAKKTLNLLNIMYDVTPADLVTAVVTELAILPCTSVPVILRIKPSEI
ncbi:Similar to EIF2B4: Translation initiation factor eIF-2B subunit delta (Homo sapiens) [Cotesia congregata]|uniref:Translation initiation factor eIF2B subunit delta n=1 Tax=Cotesia congregata TaxID=51543 RepID=A0A8J2HM18_COTCN|nr:Similar to EIF2B4: Translation initiation factor eIF-2B subunit delta (Homo sapiens) [Cotesia congregata]